MLLLAGLLGIVLAQNPWAPWGWLWACKGAIFRIQGFGRRTPSRSAVFQQADERLVHRLAAHLPNVIDEHDHILRGFRICPIKAGDGGGERGA